MRRWNSIILLIVIVVAVFIVSRDRSRTERPAEPPPAAEPPADASSAPAKPEPAKSAAGDLPVAPGKFDYYALVLSWSPTYCMLEGRQRNDGQCDADHGFVLHGLWPQYEKGYPVDCNEGEKTWVPQSVIDDVFDIMPSKGLIIHEYRAHGTCSGLSPAGYFDTSRALFKKIAIPPGFVSPDQGRTAAPGDIEKAFLAANDWLGPEMISISCEKRNLLDVRFCFTKDLEPRACGPNEQQKRLCPLPAIGIPASN
ncbi:ribonuclease T [Methyloligella sp. 2.7D]|uniref:ribonuclease T2 family protein n=1 Tax=unclassified Methyloligella TaxID=2625955 RepID=UPI00157DA7E6|nr:ribonuclease T [Methyloligella sp. GL2]QKP77054.1 ribonuclease T [Methyloligella sp. GL2]